MCLIKYRVIKTCVRAFLTEEVDGTKWIASCPDRSIFWKQNSCIQLAGYHVDPRTGFNIMDKINIL
jgi:hypothetical protein